MGSFLKTKLTTYTCAFFLIALISLQPIHADTEDNEVGENPQYYIMQGIKIYQIERQCAMVGGHCVHTSDCLEPTTNRGLCPKNSHRGVECCYELPMRPAPCVQHQGACMERCNKDLIRPGTDCEIGQVCCILV